MKPNERLQKLRQEKKLLLEAIKQAEAKASSVQRKREARAKIIVGGLLLSSPDSEREYLLSMLLPRMIERDRIFVSEFLAGITRPILTLRNSTEMTEDEPLGSPPVLFSRRNNGILTSYPFKAVRPLDAGVHRATNLADARLLRYPTC